MSPGLNPTSPIRIFYSYAHEDEPLRKELEKHLSSLKRQELITDWHDRDISAGAEWASEIDSNLNTAQIILLLISADFLASDYCYGIEMKRALERHDAHDACVIPIIARPVSMKGTPFSKLQALPTDGKAITKWSQRDEAFVDIVQGIRKVVDEMHASQAKNTSLPSTPPAGKARPAIARSSAFPFNQPLPSSREFYGRVRERETLLNRTWQAASTSIVGPRRIGKTWLIHYLRQVAPQELGSNYRIGYLDATSFRCSTVPGFVTNALEAFDLQQRSFTTSGDSLTSLEQAIQAVVSMQQVPVLCIDEFEGFGNHREFDLNFFSSLRAMTQIGLCLLVASKTPLFDIIGEYGDTSGFFNVFEQITVKPFSQKEAGSFVLAKGEQVGMQEQEREKLLHYGQYKGEYWPIRLQLAGKMLLEDKTLAQRENDPDYYRPDDQAYWQEFERRLQEIYRGITR